MSALVLAGVLLVPRPAAAGAQGCTGSNLRTDAVLLCTSVSGESTRVDNIQVSIDIAAYTCNADFKVWGTYSNGTAYSAGPKHAKCGVGRVWVDFKPPHKHFKPGTRICGALVENGKVRHEHACVKIEK